MASFKLTLNQVRLYNNNPHDYKVSIKVSGRADEVVLTLQEEEHDVSGVFEYTRVNDDITQLVPKLDRHHSTVPQESVTFERYQMQPPLYRLSVPSYLGFIPLNEVSNPVHKVVLHNKTSAEAIITYDGQPNDWRIPRGGQDEREIAAGTIVTAKHSSGGTLLPTPFTVTEPITKDLTVPARPEVYAHWKWKGNHLDSSLNAHHGVAVGGKVAFGTDPWPHIIFSGNNYVTVAPFNNIGGNWTISAWIQSVNRLHILSLNANNPWLHTQFTANYSTPTLVFAYNNHISAPFNNTGWAHVAVIYNGQTYKMYIDTQEVWLLGKSGEILESTKAHFGYSEQHENQFSANGTKIGEFIIVTKAVTEAELLLLYKGEYA